MGTQLIRRVLDLCMWIKGFSEDSLGKTQMQAYHRLCFHSAVVRLHANSNASSHLHLTGLVHVKTDGECTNLI